MTDNALLRSLAGADRLARAGDLVEVEAASVTRGGLVASHRAKVRSSAERLERRGFLTWRMGRAARRLYRSYSLGIEGAREQQGGCNPWSPAGLTDAQLGASQDFFLAREACPLDCWPVVFAVAVLDATIADLMAEAGLTSGRASGALMLRLKRGLNAVADHYDAE